MPDWALDFPRACEDLTASAHSAVIRSCAEDFQVDEILQVPWTHEGEHLYLHIQKRDTNTDWLSKQLADFAGIAPRDVGYAGIKDRHAVTTQWFSLYLPGREAPDCSAFSTPQWQVLQTCRHNKKLRRGDHQGNRFTLVLRNLNEAPEQIEARLNAIAQRGVPNYFGEQRFGIDGQNLVAGYQALMQRRRPGRQKIRNRFLRGIYLSAIRSYLFNQVLAQRVKEGNWCSAIAGDALLAQPYGALSEGPTGPLWGRGRSAATAEAADVEQRVLAPLGEVAEKLEYAGLDHERRSLVLLPGDMTWQWLEKAKLQVAFTLPAGGFATAVLRELCLYRDQSSIDRAQAGNTDMRPDKNNNNGIQ